MLPISEKWEVIVGKNKYIVSKEEKEVILNAGDARFVKFRDLVINPAFVQSITLVERRNPNQIEPVAEREYTDEERKKNRERIAEFRAKYNVKILKTDLAQP